MSGSYDDILHLPHPTSQKHPRMSRQDRAAQFSPFAALTGYEDAVKETARLTDRRVELSEDELAVLDERLRLALAWEDDPPPVSVTWFCPDKRKKGGAYVTTQGQIRKVDEVRRELVMADGGRIPIDEIAALDCPLFRREEE